MGGLLLGAMPQVTPLRARLCLAVIGAGPTLEP